MKKFLMAAGAAALAMTAQVASAATFNFSFSGTTTETASLVSGMGVLTTSDAGVVSDGSTFFEVTGLSGTISLTGFSDAAIVGPVTLTIDGESTVNAIALTNGVYSLAQLAFAFPAGTPTNLALFTGAGADLVVNGADLTIANTNFQIAAVPEPATWGLMLVGFGMVGATVRRRRVTFANA